MLVAVAVAMGSPLPGLALWAIVLGILSVLVAAEAVETRQEATVAARPSGSAVVS